MSSGEEDEDPWLGAILNFPTILHSKESLVHELNDSSLQRVLLKVLGTIASLRLPIKLSLSDHDGYFLGTVGFKIGIGNAEAFDVYDAKEQDRLLKRIESKGPFAALDLSFNASYSIHDNGRRHAVREDRFLARLIFRSGRMEVYVHHLRGMRRVRSDDVIDLLVEQINGELRQQGHTILRKELAQRKRASRSILGRPTSFID